MSKRHISKQQRQRIKALHEKRVQQISLPEQELSAEQQGLLVAHYGFQVDVEATNGKLYRCALRQNIEPLVTGDKVVWCPANDDVGVVTALIPRTSLLYRHDPLREPRPVAANVNQLVMVLAPEPEPSFELIDRYLVVAHALSLHPVIIINKIDLSIPDEHTTNIKPYQLLNYPLYFLSCEQQKGFKELEQRLANHTSVFVGQSGVGKSSILNVLLPERELQVGELHATSGLGKHTTTTTRLYHFSHGGQLIDSPGVREFGLMHLKALQVLQGFPEIAKVAAHCKFRDCQHESEPDCKVQTAIAQGQISERRLQSYKTIISSLKT